MATKAQREERTKTLLKLSGYVEKTYTSAEPWNTIPWTSAILDTLHRYETALRRINENDCNGHPRMKTEYRDGKMYRFEVEDEAWAARDAKKEASIQVKVVELLQPLGIEVKFNGDPRGGAIRMLLPDHTSNGWDGETWGIYW